MADEALVSSGYDNSFQISRSEGMSNLGKATPASILKGTIGTNSSSSIIGAAKEASRRRVEAASAARKRAENMDAIVKAAELAAEAVSQAGKIVTMGDPLALNDLVEAGPEGCWNAARESSQQVGSLKDMTSGLVNVDNVGDRPETSRICNRDISSDEMGKTAASEKSPFHTMHSEASQDHMRSIDGISPIININEKSSKGPKGRKVSDLVNPIDALPESETEIQAAFTAGNGPGNLEETNIKEGSLVEVFKDGEGFKAAWYTANILSLKDGKAYVCYTVLVDDEGAGPLKEWVSLEGEENKPPRIRTTRPLTGLHNEGTRKRRRAAMVDYTWSVGDRVDAWIQESWQEGVVTDKNKKDKTLTVHFPVSGETSVVRAWHLRPSLIWKDGKWIESPKVGANDSFTHEGDTPHEKRPKLGNPPVEVKGKGKIPKGTDAVESANPGELLNLTENDKVFNIGKNSKNENKSDAQRMVRTGLQKEGSRVIFGVPKPGKKRKFMEVSKHYVADGTSKINDGNDSVKLANFLIPHGTGSRGWKNSSKNDTKEKLGADSRPSFKSGKPQSVLGRVIPLKENPYTNDMTSRAERIKESSSHFKNASQ
ncbi:Tudor, plant [Spatholobus suberectus]|nr:Tudor, plant [Spatholobus suberectus]